MLTLNQMMYLFQNPLRAKGSKSFSLKAVRISLLVQRQKWILAI